jgi:hypothetical protein
LHHFARFERGKNSRPHRSQTFIPTRDELRRERRLRVALNCRLPELRREDLELGRFGVVRHVDGDAYRVVRGEVDDPRASPAIAYYIADDAIVFLERAR